MKPPRAFSTCVRDYAGLVRNFTEEAVKQRTELLQFLTSMPLCKQRDVQRYHDALLFTVSHPATMLLWKTAEAELKRIAEHLDGESICTPFSLSATSWLLTKYGSDVRLLKEGLEQQAISEAFIHVLDPIEYEMLGSSEMDLSGKDLPWFLMMADALPGSIQYKEAQFDRFGITVEWTTRSDSNTITTARAPLAKPYLHSEIQRKQTLKKAIAQGTPRQVKMSREEKETLVETARSVLCAMERETDPTTYPNVDEIKYYGMGRGLTAALFPMVAEMKMSVQSYIGHMVFKNGVPCAYGGSWLLFHEAGFGVNIFPAMRGGESAVVVSELIRLYNHVFGSVSFTIDPYQIGYGNSDGIKSGAFWFYHRLGFRPEQRELKKLATAEERKIKADRSYRTPVGALKVLAESTMRWNVPGAAVPRVAVPAPITAARMGDMVGEFVESEYNGDRNAAKVAALAVLQNKIGKRLPKRHFVNNIVVLLEACGYLQNASAGELRRFVKDYAGKAVDEAGYVRASQRYTLLEELVSDK